MKLTRKIKKSRNDIERSIKFMRAEIQMKSISKFGNPDQDMVRSQEFVDEESKNQERDPGRL